MGISLRRFDGWEPRQVHEHEYDETGRLIRTVVVRESEWDDDERAWMLGLALREDGECQRCGGDLHETLDYDYKWEPQPPLVCLRCLALAGDRQQYAKHPDRAGMIHRVTKMTRPQPKNRKRRR